MGVFKKGFVLGLANEITVGGWYTHFCPHSSVRKSFALTSQESGGSNPSGGTMSVYKKVITTTGAELSAKDFKRWRWLKSFDNVELVYEQHYCTIQAFFEKYPNETSVCMTCTCPRCTITC